MIFIGAIAAIPRIDWVAVLTSGAIITSIPIATGILCVKFGKNE